MPQRALDEIMQIKIGRNQIQDQAIWTPTPQGSFTCSSAYQLLRKIRENSPQLAKIWNNHLPFKISFATWRLLKGRLPLDDIVLKFGTNIISRCCCRVPLDDHVFANSNTAKKVWNTMSTPLGFQTTGRNTICHPKSMVEQTAKKQCP